MAIHLTSAARERMQRFLDDAPTAVGFRLGTKRSGCTGWSYVVEVAYERAPGDTAFDDQGVRVLVDADSLALLDGTRIDFVRTGLNQQFAFENPNVAAACGCGKSFTTDDQAA